MKNGTKILSALMACMMVATAFTMFIPATSAYPLNELGDVNVGEVVTLSGTASSNEVLNLYIDAATGAGWQFEDDADENGDYTFNIKVPVRGYGPISFIVTHATSNEILEQWDATVIPQLTVEPAEGVPYWVSEELVTLTGTGFKIGEKVDFYLERADGLTEIGSAIPLPNDKGSFTTTFKVPAIWEGSFDLIGTQGTISAKIPFGVIPGVSIVPDTFKAGKAGILTVNGAGFTQNGEIPENSIEFKHGTTGDVVNTIHSGIEIDRRNGNFTIEDVEVLFPVGGVYEVWIKYIKNLPGGIIVEESEQFGTYYVGLWINADPTSVNVGDDVTVTGHGFDGDVRVDITLDGVHKTYATTSASGSFEATFTVGNAEIGQHTIKATAASGDNASTIITVGSYIEIRDDSGTVITSGTVGPTTTFETIDNVIVARGSIYGSLGTQVTVHGTGFTANSKVNVTASVSTPGIDWESYRVVHNASVGNDGAFVASFIFPTAPNGTYTITADDSIEASADSEFTVVPGIAINPSVVIGPSVETIVATGYPQYTWSTILLIDGIDALFGTNAQFTLWEFDNNGTLVSQLYDVVIKPGFVLPILQTGTYNITLVAGGLSASQDVIVLNNLANLKEILGTLTELNATIVSINGNVIDIQTNIGLIKGSLEGLNPVIQSINGNVIDIQTNIGLIKGSLEGLNAKLLSVDGNVTKIQTEIGTVEASLDDLKTTITAVSENVVAIKTSVGTINGEITSINGKIATIQTEIGEIKTDASAIQKQTASIGSGDTQVSTDATPAWIAAVMAVIAAISAIVCVVILTRKLAG